LIVAWLAFVAQERAIELIGMFAQALLARDRSTFFCGYDLLADGVHLAIEIVHVPFQWIGVR